MDMYTQRFGKVQHFREHGIGKSRQETAGPVASHMVYFTVCGSVIQISFSVWCYPCVHVRTEATKLCGGDEVGLPEESLTGLQLSSSSFGFASSSRGDIPTSISKHRRTSSMLGRASGWDFQHRSNIFHKLPVKHASWGGRLPFRTFTSTVRSASSWNGKRSLMVSYITIPRA